MEFQSFGLILTLLIGVLGLTSAGLATASTVRYAHARSWSTGTTAFAITTVAVGAFLGGWIIYDVVQVLRYAARFAAARLATRGAESGGAV